MLGIVGAALFYGDAVITPAISVMSAIEGVVVVNPSLDGLVLPVSSVILASSSRSSGGVPTSSGERSARS